MIMNILVVIVGLFILIMQLIATQGLTVKRMIESQNPPSGVFVFGDSYVDTGNHDPNIPTEQWNYPYGSTWPGIPTGRASDGRVLTDYFVAPYRVINASTAYGREAMLTSVNFAYGGSGVFQTFDSTYTNLSAQINQLKDLLQKKIVANTTIRSSIVLIHSGGNDYIYYRALHPNEEGAIEFSANVVKQMKINIQELYGVGFRRFEVANVIPFACTPLVTSQNNYMGCNYSIPGVAGLHNEFLKTAISSLQTSLQDTEFNLLDVNNAFSQVLNGTSTKLVIAMQPCCEAIGSTGSCGVTDGTGNPLYTLCSAPNKHFFWDLIHPTNHGWKLVSKLLFKR